MSVEMYVNDDLTVRSPLGDIVDASLDTLTRIRTKLLSEKPESIILIDQSSKENVTIGQFLARVDNIAANLVKHGFNRSLPVALVMGNSLEYVYVLMAVWRLGGCSAPINALSSKAELVKYLQLLDSEIVFCDALTSAHVTSAVIGTQVKKVFVNGTHPGCIPIASLLTPKPLHPGDVRTISLSDVALIHFSSGTTGFPKGVELTHYTVMKTYGMFSIPETGFTMANYALIYQPFSHLYGTALITASLLSGKPAIIMPRFDMEEYIKCVVKYKIDKLYFVPPLAVLFTKGGFTQRYDLSHVREIFCGAAPLSDDVIDTLMKQLGSQLQVRQLYGMTEGFGTYCPPKHLVDNIPKHSIGLPMPGTILKVVDINTGKSNGPMEQGEICIMSEYKMKGYLKNKRATEDIIDKEGWLHTGDIGYYDNVGYFFIVDRLKELIKYKGLQVPPAELENVLLSHPDVADAGVTGLPDQLAGELPFAYVVLSPGSKITEKQLHAFVNDRVAKYKQLRGGIKFVAQIPKSPSGKILRRVIKQEQMGKKHAKL